MVVCVDEVGDVIVARWLAAAIVIPAGTPVCFSNIKAALRRSSTSFVRLVLRPPRQMKTTAPMPQENDAGINDPVVQAGR